MNEKDKLKALLRELFQFDCSDLDFGIYRIMNMKREAIDRFIERDLVDAIKRELSRGALGDQAQAAAEVEKQRVKVVEALGEDAIDGEGVLSAEYHKTAVGKKYLDAQARANGARTGGAVEAAIYNHLYTFFSRYYDNGDFISKRRYSRREKYAIPYNGEEVYLHWANADQYYVKTTEHFTDYRYKDGHGTTVHFKLKAADIEKDNVKGDKRFFFPIVDEAEYDADSKVVAIPFEYRPMTGQEQVSLGARNQQDKIIAEALKPLYAKFADTPEAHLALDTEHHKNGNGESVTLLAHHLKQYTRRNTSDYFIHKDLKGFLARELDFYIKNEVLLLDELEAAGESRAEGWFQIARTIRAIGTTVIGFLAQIEDFQKNLFEKKKFVVETQYCITVGNIHPSFHEDIAGCEPQWEEWKELFHIDEEERTLFTATAKTKTEKRIEFLNCHPTLVLDTKHFKSDFRDKLLASFENLDAVTDGLLIHSENYQALSLMRDKYNQKVKCIYIDPPFNTGGNEFLYKNDFLNSSWLSMLFDRAKVCGTLMESKGSYFCRIDHHGDFLVRQLFERLFGEQSFQNQLVVKRGRETAGTRGKLEVASESVFWFAPGLAPEFNEITSLRSIAEVQWTGFLMGGERKPRERTFLGITLTPPDGQHFPLGQPKVEKLLAEHFIRLRCSNCGAIYFSAKSDAALHRIMKKKDNRYKYYDITPDKVVRGVDSIKTCLECGKNAWRVDYLGAPTTAISNLWLDIESYAKANGFFTENSEPLLKRVIELASNKGEYVLDFFLGSGTTAAVAHKSGRKYIGIEMAQYFDEHPLARLKRVLAGEQSGVSREVKWNGGGIFKYIRLESYEDSLNNIRLSDAPQTLYELDDYLVGYVLDFESKDSGSLLNVAKLEKPFSYKLTVFEDGEYKEKDADLPETFAYLLGLHVESRRAYMDEDRRYLVYTGKADDRQVAVVWRETAGWAEEDFKRDRTFIKENKLADGADEVFVNADSIVPGAKSLDPVFKARMFGGSV